MIERMTNRNKQHAPKRVFAQSVKSTFNTNVKLYSPPSIGLNENFMKSKGDILTVPQHEVHLNRGTGKYHQKQFEKTRQI